MKNHITGPINSIEWVDRAILIPNDYNPNKVLRDNLVLLTISIIVNAWTLPILLVQTIRSLMAFTAGPHHIH